ncbi:hypothetical protein V8Z80_04875 [Orrella sp. JC864]|uniref:hypothetical protein n=1 Tax=Orrella sp. JC864 TaxID=3120298 RepID=UPI003008E859
MATRSLGTLTVDLITRTGGFEDGMNRASRTADQRAKQIDRSLARIGAVSVTAIAAATTATVALVRSTAQSAQEISRLATLSNTSAERFQAVAYAAQTAGIEQEKLADILKDVQDRVGDFLQTGGGPMADFFEKIAPRIGVTIEQFRRLSGPEALELFYSSLEKANLSQSELVFYMEAMASDSSLLIPLLKNNASGLRDMEQRARSLGAVMSNETIRSAVEMNRSMRELETSLTSLKNNIAQQVIPVIANLTGGLAEAARVSGSMITSLEVNVLDWLFGDKDPAKEIETVTARLNDNRRALAALRAQLDSDPEDVTQSLRQRIAVLDDVVKAGEARLALVNRRLARANGGVPQLPPIKVTGDLPPPPPAPGKPQDDLTAMVADLQLQIDIFGKSEAAAERYRIEIAKGSEVMRERALTLHDNLTVLQDMEKAQEAYQDLVKSLRTDEEQSLDLARERIAVLREAKVGLEEYATTAERIAKAAIDDAPEYGGLDATIGARLASWRRCRMPAKNWKSGIRPSSRCSVAFWTKSLSTKRPTPARSPRSTGKTMTA